MANPPASSSEELLDALRKLIQEESRKLVPAVEPVRPDYRTVAVVILVGINVALILTLFEQVLKDNKIVEVTMKVVPFLFGAAFVALLDDLRSHLLRLSARSRFVWSMVAVLLLVLSAHMFLVIPGVVRIQTAAGADVQLNGKPVAMTRDSLFIGHLLGLRSQSLITNHTVNDSNDNTFPTTDTVTLGMKDRLRVTLPARLLLGPHAVATENLYPVGVKWSETPRQRVQLRISGTLSNRAIHRIETLGVMRLGDAPASPARRGARTHTTLVADADPDGTLLLSLPVGTYGVTVKGEGCRGPRSTLEVKPGYNTLHVPHIGCLSPLTVRHDE